MYCRNCGKVILDLKKICKNCKTNPANGRNFCEKCAEPIIDCQNICMNCLTIIKDSETIKCENKTHALNKLIKKLLKKV